jgi:Flp pilus assembly protein TadD
VNVILGQSAAVITLHEWSQAAALAQKALEAAPDDARQHNNLGVIARELGDLDAAGLYFERPVSLSPDWDLPPQNLADLQSSQ